MSPHAEACFFLLSPAVYLFLLAGVNRGRRPCVLSGPVDRALLGIALVGPIFVGPVRFLPLSVPFAFWEMLGMGAVLWGLLLFLLAMLACFFALHGRQKIVVYNVEPDALEPMLRTIAPKLDPAHRWAGNSLHLPTLEIQFCLERTVWMRNAELIATSRSQSPEGWARFESELRGTLAASEKSKRTPFFAWMFALLGAGFFLLAIPSLGKVVLDVLALLF